MLYDVIIVGAGPAGATAASICAKKGLQILLLEKKQLPREKPCAGAVSLRAIRAFRLAGFRLKNYHFEREIYGLNVMGPDRRPFTIRSPFLFAYTVKRAPFDHYLVKQAVAAGAEIRDRIRVTGLELRSDRVICKSQGEQFEGKLVIGADGATSIVSKSMGLGKPRKPNEVGIAIEVDVPVSLEELERRIDPNLITLWFLNVPLGYFWAFPRRESLSLGLGGIAGGMKNLPVLLKKFARVYMQRTSLKLPPLRGIRGHILPFSGFRTPLVSTRVLLTGDAAGFIDTFSGQGICYAAESGLLAGYTAINSIRAQDFSVTRLARYATHSRQLFGEELRFSERIARFFHSHLYGGFQLCRHLYGLNEIVKDIAIGKYDYYRFRRNPIGFFGRLLKAEIRSRFQRPI